MKDHMDNAHRTPAAAATAVTTSAPCAPDPRPARKRKSGATVPAARKRARIASSGAQGGKIGQVAYPVPQTAAHSAPSPRTDTRHYTPSFAVSAPPPPNPAATTVNVSHSAPRAAVELEPYAIPESCIDSWEPLELDVLAGLCLAVLQGRPVVQGSDRAHCSCDSAGAPPHSSPIEGVNHPPCPLVQDAYVISEADLSSLTPFELDVSEGICLGLLAGRPIGAVPDPLRIHQPP